MSITVVKVIAALSFGLLTAPLVTGAQQAGTVYRIGYLSAGSPPTLMVRCSRKRSVSVAG